MKKPQAKDGSERARDEERTDGGPRYGGREWDIADERGDKRFGVARVDDANPSELEKSEEESDDVPAETETHESGGEREGMHRGEKPRKTKDREK